MTNRAPDLTPFSPPVTLNRNRLRSADKLWPWYFVTALYLGGVGWIVFDRWGEIGSLLEPLRPGEARLPLHNIGDLLAGVFAPLAFLWLFIATLLQRRELSLQRLELAETRSVLAGQQAELERAAEESNKQTRIMSETLSSSKTQEVYKAFNFELYLICRQAYKTERSSFATMLVELRIFEFQPSLYLSEADSSVIDTFIEKTLENVKLITSRFLSYENHPDFGHSDFYIAAEALRKLSKSLRELMSRQMYAENLLVAARIEWLPFHQLIAEIDKLLRWVEECELPNADENLPL